MGKCLVELAGVNVLLQEHNSASVRNILTVCGRIIE